MKSLKLTVGALVAALALVGCGPDGGTGNGNTGGGSGGGTAQQTGALTGSVTDESGVSGEADDTGSAAQGYGGRGTVSASTRVQLVLVKDDGSLEVLAESTLAANASYSLRSTETSGVLLVQSLDAQGTVLARALVTKSVVAGQTVAAQPLTSQSSVEAAVFLELVAQGHRPGDIDRAMLRTRLDERVAIAVRSAGSGDAVQAQVKAVAMAAWSAQQTQREAWARASVDVNARVQAELDALATYDAALQANLSAQAQATADFQNTLQQVEFDGVSDVSVMATTESTVSATSRRVLGEASVAASASVQAAWAHAVAQREAMFSAAAMVRVMTDAQVSAERLNDLQMLNAQLMASVKASADVAALSTAFSAWRVGIRGVATAQDEGMGLMGFLLQVQATLYATAVTQTAELAATLSANFQAAVDAAQGSNRFDFDALANASLDLREQFRADTDAKVRGTIVGMTDAQASLVVRALVTTEGSFR